LFKLKLRKRIRFGWAFLAIVALAIGSGIGFVVPLEALTNTHNRSFSGQGFRITMQMLGEYGARYWVALPFLIFGSYMLVAAIFEDESSDDVHKVVQDAKIQQSASEKNQ
jgi:hypothetical protein